MQIPKQVKAALLSFHQKRLVATLRFTLAPLTILRDEGQERAFRLSAPLLEQLADGTDVWLVRMRPAHLLEGFHKPSLAFIQQTDVVGDVRTLRFQPFLKPSDDTFDKRARPFCHVCNRRRAMFFRMEVDLLGLL